MLQNHKLVCELYQRCYTITGLIKASGPGQLISQLRWLSGLMRRFVHSLMIARHCVVRNWDLIPVRAVRGLIARAGMVSICPLL